MALLQEKLFSHLVYSMVYRNAPTPARNPMLYRPENIFIIMAELIVGCKPTCSRPKCSIRKANNVLDGGHGQGANFLNHAENSCYEVCAEAAVEPAAGSAPGPV